MPLWYNYLVLYDIFSLKNFLKFLLPIQMAGSFCSHSPSPSLPFSVQCVSPTNNTVLCCEGSLLTKLQLLGIMWLFLTSWMVNGEPFNYQNSNWPLPVWLKDHEPVSSYVESLRIIIFTRPKEGNEKEEIFSCLQYPFEVLENLK